MAYALPSFSTAANYRLSPVAGGIAGPVPGYKDVKSTRFADTLGEIPALKALIESKLAVAATQQLGATERQKIVTDGAMDRLEFAAKMNEKMQKSQTIAALAPAASTTSRTASLLGSGGQRSAGGGLFDPLKSLLGYERIQDNLDLSRINRTKPYHDSLRDAFGSLSPSIKPTSVQLPKSSEVLASVTSPPELGSMKEESNARLKFAQEALARLEASKEA